MGRLSTSENVKNRLRLFLERLLGYANYELPGCDRFLDKVIVRWLDEEKTNPKLVIQSNELRFLIELIFQKRIDGTFRSRWKNDFYVLKDFLGILEDNRIKAQGAKPWHFTLTMWSKKTDINLAKFEEYWENCTFGQSQTNNPQETSTYISLEEAPDVSEFYGRTDELNTLQQWIFQDRCRLVAVVGMGGIGKTALVAKFSQQIKDKFQYIIWCSLREAPPIEKIMGNLIKFLSNQQNTDLPETIGDKITKLIEYLKNSRCLIILDNTEAILQAGTRTGKYREGYEYYGELFQLIGERLHQSCLLITSREKPREINLLEGDKLLTRSLRLNGLTLQEGRKIFNNKGTFFGSDEGWKMLIEHYSGNPLALMIVAKNIRILMNESNIDEFAQESINENFYIFDDINDLLERQFKRLSVSEQRILYWLAIGREPVSRSQLIEDSSLFLHRGEIPEVLLSLTSRSLLEKVAYGFTLQNVIMEYMTEKLIQKVYEEIKTGNLDLFQSHCLLKALAKDYVRETQIRLIVKPVIERLIQHFGSQSSLETKLTQIISELQGVNIPKLGYTAGNIINLLCQMETNLTGYDFSHLPIWQAYLQYVNLHNVNFAYCDFKNTIFTKSFGGIWAVTFSPNGEYLAVGDTNGEIRLLRIKDGQQITVFKKHRWWIICLAFSPDGKKLVSCSFHPTIKLWDVDTGQCLKNLEGHTHWVWAVDFSANGQMIASGSDDTTIKLWNAKTGEYIRTLQGHTSLVLAVSFAPNNSILASSSYDKTIKIWDIHTGQCLNTLEGHEGTIWSVVFSPDGKTIASGSADKTIKIWNPNTGECLNTLEGHTSFVFSVAFSPDGKRIASGCFEPKIRLWDANTGECLNTLIGHRTGIRSLAFSPDSQTIVSGDIDQTAKLWDANTGKCVNTLQGYIYWVWDATFSPDAKTIASCHLDYNVRLWDVDTGKCLSTFRGHKDWVWSVTFSPDGQTIASSGDDQTIKLWDRAGKCFNTLRYLEPEDNDGNGGIWTVAFSSNGQFLASGGQSPTLKLWNLSTGTYQILEGHLNWIWTVAFSPDNHFLASGSDDHTIKIWDVTTEECLCLKTLEGHSNKIRSVVFSPDGKFLVSGSEDYTLKLWKIDTGECFKTFKGHQGWVWSVTFSSNGKFLVSGSEDCTIKIWDVKTGKCIKTIEGHQNKVESVAVSFDSKKIVSCSTDGTLKLWDFKSGDCLKIMRVPRPYEGTNITGVTGLTDVQQASLQYLGAFVKVK